MKQSEVKTIDIQAKEWFDKVNGNSYFSARITLNYGMQDATDCFLPFEYGYGDFYIDKATQELERLGYISPEHYSNGGTQALWAYCQDKGIVLRTNKQKGCKKRDLKLL